MNKQIKQIKKIAQAYFERSTVMSDRHPLDVQDELVDAVWCLEDNYNTGHETKK